MEPHHPLQGREMLRKAFGGQVSPKPAGGAHSALPERPQLLDLRGGALGGKDEGKGREDRK